MVIAVFLLSLFLVALIFSMLSFSFFPFRRRESQAVPNENGYILNCKTTHARLLPVESRHAFSYPTLSLLVSLNALETRSLDLGNGWIFGYGGGWALTGFRPSAYFHPESPGMNTQLGEVKHSIKEKLVHLLDTRGHHGNSLEDVWMLSMPSFLGFEGLNPLTVYFCYANGGQLWIVVLETHNTFGERHVDLLVVGKDNDDNCPQGFDHQWTIPRGFHVSPFNDRTGFYRVSITQPSSPPTKLTSPHSSSSLLPPLPCIRIQYLSPDLTSSPSDSPIPGPLKLIATLRTTSSTHLSTLNLLAALLRQPFALLSTISRIFYQAWILHYVKRLDVYPRPEPYPAVPDWDASGQGVPPRKRSGGVGWLPEGLLDRYSRTLVEGFIQKRVDELESSVTLVSADPSVPRKTFEPRGDVKIKDHLHISYLSPRFFTTLLLAPSAKHALLLGGITERLFVASSPESFLRLFETSDSDLGMDCDLVASLSLQQRLRVWMIPEPLVGASLYPIPFRHPLDAKRTLSFESFKTLTFLFTSVTLDFVERALYIALHARFVPGGEPWKRWHRALQHM